MLGFPLMALQVVILSRKSLMADGILSQLAAHAEAVAVEPLDVAAPGALDRFSALAPAVALVDMNDTEVVKHIGIAHLLDLSPTTKVFQLNPNSDEIRIYSTLTRRAQGIGELLEVMQSVAAFPKGGPTRENSKSSIAPHTQHKENDA